MNAKIKVLVIDDSTLMRSLLTNMINKNYDMEVVAGAADIFEARELIKLHNPDVLTLDVDLPNINGLEFLEHLMRLRPMPVLMVSMFNESNSDVTLRAMELGAVDFITKPNLNSRAESIEFSALIAYKIRIAVQANILNSITFEKTTVSTLPPRKSLATSIGINDSQSGKLLAMGASTGGTVAITSFLMEMPVTCPGIVITQHMPAGFTKSFADRLNKLCQISVSEAVDGEPILSGHAYIAPGNRHMLVVNRNGQYVIKLDNSEAVNHHKPSVDVLFNSVSETVGQNAIGIILTGMGKDGAHGMWEMKQMGAYNFAQDEQSCVVYGMPKEAVKEGGVDVIADIKDLPKKLLQHLSR